MMSDARRPEALVPAAGSHAAESTWLLGYLGEALIAVPRACLLTVEQCPLTPAPPWAAPWVGALALHGTSPVLALRLNGAAPADAPAASGGLIALVGDGSWGIWIDRLAGFAGGQDDTSQRRQLPVTWPCPISFLQALTLSDGRPAWSIDATAITARLCAVI